MKKKVFIIIAFFALLAGVIVIVQNGFFLSPSQSISTGNKINSRQDVPQKVALTGVYVCLPHKDTRGPQTDECAFGMKTDHGHHYALDMSTQPTTDMETDVHITAQGVLVPIEMISSNSWERYDIKGIMQVEKIDRI